jgi:hypothetical protein
MKCIDLSMIETLHVHMFKLLKHLQLVGDIV